MKQPSQKGIEKLFGERLNTLRIKKGFKTVEAFGTAVNNGKIHKDFSAYIKGKNIRFDTLLKFVFILKYDIQNLLDFTGKLPLITISDNLSISDLSVLYMARFTENLKRLRKRLNKTQLDLDVEIAIDRSNISNYEIGDKKPNLLTIEKLAQGLQVTPFELFRPLKKGKKGNK